MKHLLLDAIVAAFLALFFWGLQRRAFPCEGRDTAFRDGIEVEFV